jgi:hypothetical protein
MKVGVDDYLLHHSTNDLLALAKPFTPSEAAPEHSMSVEEMVEDAITGRMEPKHAILELQKGGTKRPEICRAISFITISILRTTGRFIRTSEGRFYFDSNTKGVLALDEFPFAALLNARYCVNQSTALFKHVLVDANTEAHLNGVESRVHRLAYFDAANSLLYIDRFDGCVYRLDGKKIDIIENGTDGVLFTHPSTWQPYHLLDGSPADGQLALALIEDVHFSDTASALSGLQQRLIVTVWLFSLFFETLLQTKPVLLFTGEKGSGKTTFFRRLLKFLFGPDAEVFTLEKDKEDSFIAVITNYSLAVFDNVDGGIPWLNDRLATAATGGEVTRRKLYTTNDLVTYQPHCFLGLTSISAKFRREDVADRLVVLHVDRLGQFTPERNLHQAVLMLRDQLWTELLHDLNRIVASLRDNPAPTSFEFRLADWAGLGHVIAQTQGVEAGFLEALRRLKEVQSEFTLGENPLFALLTEWLEDSKNHDREVTAKELYQELKTIAESNQIKFRFSSPLSLAKKLNSLQSDLKTSLKMDVRHDNRSRTWYCFRYRSAPVGEVTR